MSDFDKYMQNPRTPTTADPKQTNQNGPTRLCSENLPTKALAPALRAPPQP